MVFFAAMLSKRKAQKAALDLFQYVWALSIILVVGWLSVFIAYLIYRPIWLLPLCAVALVLFSVCRLRAVRLWWRQKEATRGRSRI